MSAFACIAREHQPTMYHSPERAAQILAEVGRILQMNEPDNKKLRRLWVTLAYIQSYDLGNTLILMIGEKVYSGPFKGMQLTAAVKVGAYTPVLLGTYEHELHPTIERAIAQPYQKIINIGCGYGYYSVGLALRMPHITVDSFDTDPKEQQRSREMAALNNVQERLKISGLFRGEDFASYAGKDTLLIMDIEGAEMQLLDPVLYPALQKMDIIVELHDVLNPVISQTITQRFAATHDIEIVHNRPMLFDFASIVGPDRYTDPFDGLLATWENRDGPTPWGVMRAKTK